MDAQRHKLWSKRHGHDTYGSDNSNMDKDELKPKGQKHTSVDPTLTNIPTIVTVLIM